VYTLGDSANKLFSFVHFTSFSCIEIPGFPQFQFGDLFAVLNRQN